MFKPTIASTLCLLSFALSSCGGNTTNSAETLDASSDSSPDSNAADSTAPDSTAPDSNTPDSALDSNPSDSSIGVGPVTYHFVNPFTADLYIEFSIGQPSLQLSQNGKNLPIDTFCTSICGANCGCMACGAPMPAVRKIPAKGSYDFVWSGAYYDKGTCAQGCACSIPMQANPGLYKATLQSGMSYEVMGEPGTSTDPNIIQMAHVTGAQCDAIAESTLQPGAQTVEVQFVCPK